MPSNNSIHLRKETRQKSNLRSAARPPINDPRFSQAEAELLRQLQQDASLSLAELSARCGMAQSTVWRKVQEFETNGVILRRVALLDPAQVGCKLSVLANVTLIDNTHANREAFAEHVDAYAEIIECSAVSGHSDYLLKIRVADMEAYDMFQKHALLGCNLVRDIQSSFVLHNLKSTTELPIS